MMVSVQSEDMDWIDRARKQREIEGNVKYGPIHPVDDCRCFHKEMEDELLDVLNYAQWSMERGEISLCEWVFIDWNIRFVFYRLNRIKN